MYINKKKKRFPSNINNNGRISYLLKDIITNSFLQTNKQSTQNFFPPSDSSNIKKQLRKIPRGKAVKELETRFSQYHVETVS